MELCLDEVLAKPLWIRIKGQSNMDDALVGICCRLPHQEADEVCRQEEEALHLQAAMFTGGFNRLSTCWRLHAAGHKQSRRLLKCTDNFLTLKTEEMMRRDALLDLAFLQTGKNWLGRQRLGAALAERVMRPYSSEF